MSITRPPEVNNGISTNWLALTTQGPSIDRSCASSLYLRPYLASPELFNAFDPWYGSAVVKGVTCVPNQVSSWWFGLGQTSTSVVNSLGPFVCPSGYTTGATSSLNAESTLIGCCPSSYTFQGFTNVGPGQCVYPLTPGQVYTAKAYSGTQWLDTTSTMTASSTIIGAQVNGYMFSIAPTSTSISSTIPTTSLTSSSSSSTASPAFFPLASTSSDMLPSMSSRTISAATVVPTQTVSSTSTAQHSLSSGAKAGVGVGVTLGIVGMLFFAAAMFLKRRKGSSSPSKSEAPEQSYQDFVTSFFKRREHSPSPTKSKSLGQSYQEFIAPLFPTRERSPALIKSESPKKSYHEFIASLFTRRNRSPTPTKSESSGQSYQGPQKYTRTPIYEALAKSPGWTRRQEIREVPPTLGDRN